jgi:hypothetical protein
MTTTLDPTTDGTHLTEEGALAAVPYDPYRNVHKGIRSGLFRVTAQAGSLDPGDRCSREGLAEDVRTLFTLMLSHAEHEDEFVQPHIEVHAPYFAEVIAADHPRIEARMRDIQEWAERAAGAPSAEQRVRIHNVYRELASFTGAYLEHQDFEERQVMPALAAVMTVDEVVAVEQAIVASIPPDEMALGLGLMLPALNIEDRVELLGGMQADAPPEVFAGVWALAGSVLTDEDVRSLGARLGVV